MSSERKEYLLDEFINTVQFKIDILKSDSILNALPIIVYNTEKINKQFAMTVFRLPDEAGTLIWTIFMNEGKDMLPSFPTGALEYNIGNYIDAEILSQNIKSDSNNTVPGSPNRTESGIYLR